MTYLESSYLLTTQTGLLLKLHWTNLAHYDGTWKT